MFSISPNRMNTKTSVILIFAAALVTTISSASGGLEEDMPYKSLLRELWRKESDMKETFDEATSIKSKRTEDCDLINQPCSVAVDCEISTCEGQPLQCYYGECGRQESYWYKR
ncbi:hypothetical protein pdam_00008090 [Pocillopora damicornis]|uniref:WAP domain-containing protein n=2 Tax=Pocillopora damicornis TaxID=46731 RepID=A0A3M6UDG8_POCDA|nr:hypothetical protein pdam_00008090 [Pocillopora damicornis]